MSVAPDLIEEVIGYRQWRVAGDRLLSTAAVGVEWVPGTNTARCYGPGACIAAPGHDCDCGLYATHLPFGSDELGDTILGAVAAWGNLEVHRDGFRAEHARIVALAYPLWASADVMDRLGPIAARFGVGLVSVRELEATAAQYGKPLLPAQRASVAWRRIGGLCVPIPDVGPVGLKPSADRPYDELLRPFPRVGLDRPTRGWGRRVVDPTIAPRHLTRDQVYLHLGPRSRTLFHLRVFEAPNLPAVVLAGDLDGDTGRSVANAAGEIAAEIATRLLPDQQFTFIEHYQPGRGQPAFTPLTFGVSPRTLIVNVVSIALAVFHARDITWPYGHPRWGDPLTQEQVEEIVGQPIVVFPAGCHTAETIERAQHAPHAQDAPTAR